MELDKQASRLIKYMQSHGMVRPKDLEKIGVARQVLKRLVQEGKLVFRSRGVYTTPEHEPTRYTDLAEICARVPKATVCLISALDFHELTTQIAHSVWIMIDRAGHRPKIQHPPTRIIYASGQALKVGVDTHLIEGVKVPITNPAKTVAGCFKYRDHVGQDVALEALRECLRQRKATPAQIYEMVKIDRVVQRVRPYLEALI
jgi:predicted transcriptional regulator of viral defense system